MYFVGYMRSIRGRYSASTVFVACLNVRNMAWVLKLGESPMKGGGETLQESPGSSISLGADPGETDRKAAQLVIKACLPDAASITSHRSPGHSSP